MKCYLTGCDEWESVDHLRFKPQGMMINKDSGFVTYPDRLKKSEEELKEYYRKDYRKPPTVQNLFTGQRKLHYHEHFLKSVFEEWNTRGLDKPVIGEQGSAFGMVLNWFRDKYPEADLNGTEWTTSMKRVAWHEFNLRLEDDLPEKDYDLLVSYKVLEHQMDPVEKLKTMRTLLKDDGYLYISVPIWFGQLTNFGKGGLFDIEYYYHPDHINAWTEDYFESCLAASGFEVVKKDTHIYDHTYLCKKTDKNPVIKVDGYDYVMERIECFYKVATLIQDGKFEQALELYPNHPAIYGPVYEQSRKQWHEKGFDALLEQFIGPALEMTDNSFEVLALGADISCRYEKWKTALDFLEDMDKMRPNQPSCLMALGNIYRQLAQRAKSPAERADFHNRALGVNRHLAQVSLQKRNEAINWIYFDESHLPTPFEGE